MRSGRGTGGVGLVLASLLAGWGLLAGPVFGIKTQTTVPRSQQAAPSLDDLTPSELSRLKDGLTNQLPASISPENILASMPQEELSRLASQHLGKMSEQQLLALLPPGEVKRMAASYLRRLTPEQALAALSPAELRSLVVALFKEMPQDKIMALLVDRNGQLTNFARIVRDTAAAQAAAAPETSGSIAAGPVAPVAPQSTSGGSGSDATGASAVSSKPGADATPGSNSGSNGSNSGNDTGNDSDGDDEEPAGGGGQTQAPANRAPVAVGNTYNIAPGQSVTLRGSASDADGDDLKAEIGSYPSNPHGRLSAPSCSSGKGGSMTCTATYTADADFRGSISATFRVTDGKANSNWATLKVNVG